MSGMNIGTKNGETWRGPFFKYALHCSSKVWIPPMPLPIRTPVRSPAGLLRSQPASRTAKSAAATPNWANRSARLASLRPM